MEVCALNDERIEAEYTLKQRLNDMADILKQKYTLFIKDPKELEERLKDVCSEISNYRSFASNEHIRSYVRRCIPRRFIRDYNFTKNVDMSIIQGEPKEAKTAAEECIEHLKEAIQTTLVRKTKLGITLRWYISRRN